MWLLLAKKRSWTAGESLHFISAPMARTEDQDEAHDESMQVTITMNRDLRTMKDVAKVEDRQAA